MRYGLIVLVALYGLFALSCSTYSTDPEEPPSTLLAFTFDDGNRSIYEAGFPIMDEYGFVATSFVNTAWTDRPNKMNWDMLVELEHERGWEIGGHTLHHINMPSCDSLTVVQEVECDWQNLVDHGLSHSSFALPFGLGSARDREIVLRYYSNIRTSQVEYQYLPFDRHNIGYKPMLTDMPADDMIEWIEDGLLSEPALIVVGFHTVYTDAELVDAPYEMPSNCTPTEFRKIMQYVDEKGFRVVTISEATEILCDQSR